MRTIAIALAALLVGFVGGRFFNRGADTDAPRTAPGSRELAEPASPSPVSMVELRPQSKAKLPSASTDPIQTRLSAVQMITDMGFTVGWVQLLEGNQFHPKLAAALNTSASEKAAIEDAALGARRALEDARLALATPSHSADGSTLIIDVPALDPTASAAIYDQTRHALERALGPDRFSLLLQLTSDSLDRSFDQFGLNSLRYELSLTPRAQTPRGPLLEYKRSFRDAAGHGSGQSTGRNTFQDFERSEPILARFIPAHLRGQ